MHGQISAACAVALLLTACAGDGEGLDENGRPASSAEEPLLPQFSSIQSKVFTPICTACHSGAAAPLGLRLDEGAAYAMLVNTPSVEVPALNRVTPGNPDASYLIHKIEGSAAVGGRMPLNSPPLPAATIAAIRQWIADGAQRPTAAIPTGAASKAASIEALWPMPGSVMREPPQEILLSSETQLDTTLLSAGTITLLRRTEEGEHEIGTAIAVRSLDPTVIALAPAAAKWSAGRYELRVSAGAPLAVSDLAARPIDGDHDGEPGGDFVLQFELEGVR